MKYPFCQNQLYEIKQKLSDVAMGRAFADCVIKNATLVNVCTKELMPNTDIAISNGRICLIGDATHCIGADTNVIDATGLFVSPAFFDAHLHIESSMLTVREYASAVVPHGTASICIDPHEICNVLGIKGLEYMLKDSKRTPLKVMAFVPSCVPSMPGFEDAGATITVDEVKSVINNDQVFGLGEMMNYVGIVNNAEGPHDIVEECLKQGKIVSGHYSTPDTGNMMNAYFSCGINDCHESTYAPEALEKLRRGVHVFFREGSASRNLEELSTLITKNNIDTRHVAFCTDDIHPDEFATKGHIDHIVRKAIKLGVPVLTAYQIATINPAEIYGVDKDTGSISLGKVADLILLDNLEDVRVKKVLINGKLVAENNAPLFDTKNLPALDEEKINTVNVSDFTLDTFKIKTENDRETVRVISIVPSQLPTNTETATIYAKDGNLVSDTEQDILKALVFERHNKTGKIGYGFIKGFGIKRGAIASTVAHDCHNLMVVGTSDEDMFVAAQTLKNSGGGMCVVLDGKVLSLLPLSVAGLMSDKSAEETAKLVSNLKSSWDKLGCKIPEPFMTMSFLSLACIPSLRLTNRGLVDTNNFCFVDLIVK